ncbi:MAG: hypothetical protein DRH37_02525 [Deltaproteobacteria bacterium]|nr:MAG: hypothetical protein DRH37_02525 [Deltaproteobacteria bacterium]
MFQFLLAGRKGGTADVVDGRLQVGVSASVEYEPKNKFMVSPAGSPRMNVNGAATGGTDGIHDGTDSALWTGSALSGAWDFASTDQAASGTKSIDATAVSNGDQAQLTRSTPIDAGGYTVITGSVYLVAYNDTKNTIDISGRLGGVGDGTSINLGDHINTSLLNAWQPFQLLISLFGVVGNIDEMIITITSTGTPPGFYLDDINLREGGGESFALDLDQGAIFEYNRIDMIMVDAYTGIATVAGATENATMYNLSYDQFLGLPALDKGMTFQRRVFDEIITSGNVKGMGEAITGGAGRLMSVVSDGTNTMMHIRLDFSDWVRLSESDGDNLYAVVNDDMTGLIDFKTTLSGREVKQ